MRNTHDMIYIMSEPGDHRASLPVKDRLSSISQMGEHKRATETFPQVELPPRTRVIGGVGPVSSDKAPGYLSRLLVKEDIAHGVVTRNQVTSAVLKEGEEFMLGIDNSIQYY